MKNQNPFPIDLLPKALARPVKEFADGIGCDLPYVALPALTACSSAIGATRCLLIRRGWREYPILWAAVVSVSGTAKTPGLNAVQENVDAEQEQLIEQYNRELGQYRTDLAKAKAEQKKWDSNPEGERPELPDPPLRRRVIASDSTIEALTELLAENERGFWSVHDELSGHFGSFGQYKGKGGGNDEALWLSLFSGKTIIKDRKGNGDGGEHLFIRRPCLSICGGIQPKALQAAFTGERFASGMAARWLLSYPDQSALRTPKREISEASEVEFGELLAALWQFNGVADQHGKLLASDVKLSPEARQAFNEFVERNADEQEASDDDTRAMLAKSRTYAARLALVVHCIRVAGGESVEAFLCDEQSMQAGIGLAGWFADQSRHIYGLLASGDDPFAKLVQWISQRGGRCTARDLYNNLSRYRNKRDDAERDLQILVDEERGHWETYTPTPRGGAPVTEFVLNDDENNSHQRQQQQHNPGNPKENEGFAGAGGAGGVKNNGRSERQGRYRP